MPGEVVQQVGKLGSPGKYSFLIEVVGCQTEQSVFTHLPLLSKTKKNITSFPVSGFLGYTERLAQLVTGKISISWKGQSCLAE